MGLIGLQRGGPFMGTACRRGVYSFITKEIDEFLGILTHSSHSDYWPQLEWLKLRAHKHTHTHTNISYKYIPVTIDHNNGWGYEHACIHTLRFLTNTYLWLLTTIRMVEATSTQAYTHTKISYEYIPVTIDHN